MWQYACSEDMAANKQYWIDVSLMELQYERQLVCLATSAWCALEEFPPFLSPYCITQQDWT